MANMTFKANLLPNSNLGYNLGSSEKQWTVYGAFKGNADTATALTSSAGSSTVPIYFSGGKPVQCSTTLGVSITGSSASCTGNALTATTLQTTRAIKIGNKSNNFNGSTNITYLLKDMQTAAQYNVGSTASNSYILVTINKETSWMLNFTLKLYQSYVATDIQISGYNYGTSHWYSPQARILGSTTTGAIKVYFGYTGDWKLWVAVDGGNYNGGAVCDVCNGYTQIDYENAFTLTKVNSLPGTTQTTVTAYRPWYRDETVSNAATASAVAWGNVTGKPSTFTPASHSHSYLPLSGGSVTGYTSMNNHLMCMTQTAGFGFTENGSALQLREVAGVCASQSSWHYAPKIGFHWGNRIARQLGMNADGWLCFLNQSSDTSFGVFKAGVVYGAVWNDYAEMRNIPEAQFLMKEKKPVENYEEIKRNIPLAGYCVYEVGDDTMALSTKRLQRGCKIISDTFGFNIGETEDAKTPVAVCGRVLAYPYEDREEYRNHIGDFVCSGPEGTISIMTDEEALTQPWSIIGTISAVPDYERWGEDNVLVDGRIWIYVR